MVHACRALCEKTQKGEFLGDERGRLGLSMSVFSERNKLVSRRVFFGYFFFSFFCFNCFWMFLNFWLVGDVL